MNVDDSRLIDCFLAVLAQATAEIGGSYMQMPVANGNAIHRERVYCYELYHQLRRVMDEDGPWPDHVLAGEVDKSGHPIIVDDLGPVKPDFLVHGPGHMHHNLVVMEVKSASNVADGFDDIDKLQAFLELPEGPYQAGIFLVYGESDHLAEIVPRLREVATARSGERIIIVTHARPGEEAVPVSA